MKKIVDSCGWLEYLSDGPNSQFFAPHLMAAEDLLVPTLCIFEVCRVALVQKGSTHAHMVYQAMQVCRQVQLDAHGMYLAALSSKQHKLAMADAIIWQTAQIHHATLYTQDAAFEGLPGVVYQAKPVA